MPYVTGGCDCVTKEKRFPSPQSHAHRAMYQKQNFKIFVAAKSG